MRCIATESAGNDTSAAMPTMGCSAKNARSSNAAHANASANTTTWNERLHRPISTNQRNSVEAPKNPRATSSPIRTAKTETDKGASVSAYTTASAAHAMAYNPEPHKRPAKRFGMHPTKTNAASVPPVETNVGSASACAPKEANSDDLMATVSKDDPAPQNTRQHAKPNAVAIINDGSSDTTARTVFRTAVRMRRRPFVTHALPTPSSFLTGIITDTANRPLYALKIDGVKLTERVFLLSTHTISTILRQPDLRCH